MSSFSIIVGKSNKIILIQTKRLTLSFILKTLKFSSFINAKLPNSICLHITTRNIFINFFIYKYKGRNFKAIENINVTM